MESKRPLILVTNDDSISSKGIRSLYEAVLPFGDIIVIAPDSPQSGMGHAITINDPLRMEEVDALGGVGVYSCSGTPVDCVKLGISEVMHQKPDLIVSGINHGANTATNVLYSGTMSAAIEGAMEGIPSIGFSLDSFDPRADFTVAMKVVEKIVKEALENGIPTGNCLNVNIPYVQEEDFKGLKVCRQANAYWEDRFDKRLDHHNRTYYWLTGDFKDQEEQTDTDVYWISKGYATVVPTQFDMTAYDIMEKIENWNI
jgi:5'-nucleotidase